MGVEDENVPTYIMYNNRSSRYILYMRACAGERTKYFRTSVIGYIIYLGTFFFSFLFFFLNNFYSTIVNEYIMIIIIMVVERGKRRHLYGTLPVRDFPQSWISSSCTTVLYDCSCRFNSDHGIILLFFFRVIRRGWKIIAVKNESRGDDDIVVIRRRDLSYFCHAAIIIQFGIENR